MSNSTESSPRHIPSNGVLESAGSVGSDGIDSVKSGGDHGDFDSHSLGTPGASVSASKWFCGYHSAELDHFAGNGAKQPAGPSSDVDKPPAALINVQSMLEPVPLLAAVPDSPLLPPVPEAVEGLVEKGPTPTSRMASVSHIEDAIFNIFKNDDEKVNIGDFLKRLTLSGIRKTDPRMKEMLQELRNIQLEKGGTIHEPVESLTLDRDQFVACINTNIVIINRILRNKVIIPDWEDFTRVIEEIYEGCRSSKVGRVAQYIPQLGRVNPNCWGVSVCTVDGQRVSLGDTSTPFCIQSAHKALNYALALQELGASEVHKFVGQEPSGRMFNELALDHNNKPHNPMINAGAIVICSLLKRDWHLSDRYDHVLKFYQRLAGGDHVGFNNAVFLSERDASDRNYALAYYLRENKCFPEGTNLQETMDLYFQANSLEISCESGAVMAATFANGGICPITDEPVLNPYSVRDVLSLMYSCGMYDYSGQFAFKIGLPAKASVSGVVLLVVPNVMGICLYSPLLDQWGNSVKGIKFCEELVKVFNFHNYDNLKRTHRKTDPRRRRIETKGQQVVNLLFSAANGDVTAIRRYLLQGIDMSMSDYDGRTALHLAAAEGHQECVEFLAQKCHVPVDVIDRWNNSPLDDARANGHMEVVAFLERLLDQRPLDISSDDGDHLAPTGDSGYSSVLIGGAGSSTPRKPD